MLHLNTVPAKRRAFTLVEIMITVLIIGILLAIAVPNFVRAREASRARSCVKNLWGIDQAKEQWAMDHYAAPDMTAPPLSQLCGSNGYLRTIPVCPSGGDYSVNDFRTDPVCSLGTLGIFPHVLN